MSSNVYYRFGNQGPRYGFEWNAGAGGVWPGSRAARSSSLGSLSGASIGGASTISGSSVHGNTLANDTLGALLWESQSPMTKAYPPIWKAAHDRPSPVETTWKLPALSDWPSMLPAGPEPLDPSGLGQENGGNGIGGLMGMAGMAAGVYHGYKRNDSVAWALGWGLLGGLFPIPTTVIAVAQGFGKKKRRKNPARRAPVARYGKARGRKAVSAKRSRAAKKGWKRRRR